MARKKKKSSKHTRRGRAKMAASRAAAEKAYSDPVQLESLTNQALNTGNFSRAREGFKRLHRLDPEKFEAALAQTTLRAAEELFEKERLNECKNLLNEFAKLKSTDAEDCATAELLGIQCQLITGSRKMQISAAVSIFNQEPPLPGLQSRAVDVLVLEKHELAQNISKAITALCGKDWDQLELALKTISRQSPFAEWRLFLTGCGAFHRENKEFSRKCFSRLKEGTLPDKKAKAYRAMLGDLDPLTHGSARKELEHFTGTKEIFKYVSEADRHWKKGKPDRARKALCRINGFPGFKPDLVGHLTRNFLNSLTGLDPDDIYDMVVPDLPEFLKNPKPGAMSFFRAVPFLSALGEGDSEEFPGIERIVEKQWDLYEKSFISFFGSSARFRAIVRVVRAKQNIAVAGMSFSIFGDGPPDLAGAIPYLKKAIEIDPGFEEPHFMLLDVYHSENDKSAHNKLLDVMTERFPESPNILKLAGERCVDRSAFKKAIDYFERAEAIDPLDRSTKHQLYKANVKLAISHVVKDKAHLLRPVLERLPLYSELDSGPVFFRDEFRIAFSDVAWILTRSARELESPNLPNVGVEEQIPHLLFSFYRQMAWGFIYFSAPKTNFGIIPLPDLPKPTKNNVRISDGIKMLKLLTDQLGLSHSTLNFEWVCQYIDTSIRYLKKEDFLNARPLGLLIVAGLPACARFADPLSKKTKKVNASDFFFQIFRAVIEKKFTKDIDSRIENLNANQSNDSVLSALILRYKELRDRKPNFGFPEDFDPFGFGEDDFDDDDFNLPQLPPLPKPGKPKPRPAKKDVSPAIETNDVKEIDSNQQEFDFF